jgi:hypothetical protein
MAGKDYYLILGVARSESPAGIRARYRDLVRSLIPMWRERRVRVCSARSRKRTRCSPTRWRAGTTTVAAAPARPARYCRWGQRLPLELAEQDFDLVQPGGVDGQPMKVDEERQVQAREPSRQALGRVRGAVRDPRGPLGHPLDHRDQPAAVRPVARLRGRSNPGRCHLRPPPPQRTPNRAKRTLTEEGGEARELTADAQRRSAPIMIPRSS